MSKNAERAIADYLAALRKNLAHGDATEHTHRPALKDLLEAIEPNITATNDPRRIKCGAPDFNITRRKIPLGHIETKDIGGNLNEMERGRGPNGEQFTRYRDGLPNWILTDYLDFRWYVNGEKRLVARVANLDGKGKIKSLPSGEEELTHLLNAFFKQSALTIGTAKDLAERMAGMTRIIRDLIIKTFEHEAEQGWLHDWLSAFREVLIPDLGEQQFADMFAQTLAYGLFAARVHTPPNREFSREMAAFDLPKTNPFLRKLFSEIAGVDMPETIAWAVDDIVELLRHADMSKILRDFGKGKGKEDPVVHFYETFLTAYDPKMRELRGVYYTPEPVVSYIVHSIDHLLKTRFRRTKGLVDENTLILDPATGTATFLYFVIAQIYDSFAKQKGAWDSYVAKHLLNRIFGLELLMAPYAVAHLKLAMQLADLRYSFASDQRLGIYLTNTLEEAAKKSDQLFARWIAEEANAAATIKRDDPILVVLGNPPYSGHSANRSSEVIKVEKGQRYLADFELSQGRINRVMKTAAKTREVVVPNFIGELLMDYYVVDGAWLDEKNPKWLQNDYVKFIRFAQWRIDRTGEGIVGYITAHSYLDNATFCGMRQNLMQSFNEIYVYDLHGNPQKEKPPDGSKDENVFDITQGVAILLCVKEKGNDLPANVHHAHLWGDRKSKYQRLAETDVGNTEWKQLTPSKPFYLFVPQDTTLRAEYEEGSKITDIMPLSSVGVVTGQDSKAIAWTSEGATALAHSSNLPPAVVRPIYYRPFDIRFIVYDKKLVTRRRFEVMQHMLASNNLALIISRLTKGETFRHAQVTRNISEVICMSPKTSNNGFLFPLYLHPSEGELDLHKERRPNLNPLFVQALAEKLKLPQLGEYGLPKGITPEDILYYGYAVFYSRTYQTRYAEFLKRDFPRLPLTSDVELFHSLAAKGAELVALHLMESSKLNDLITEFPEKGNNEVERVQYIDKDKRVWINKTQYFGGVPKAVWEFHVGGYQVCEKWLKDRKGRKLSYEDIQHYQKIVVALGETIRVMGEVEALVPRWPIT